MGCGGTGGTAASQDNHASKGQYCILMAMWNGRVLLHVVIMIAPLAVMTIYTVMPQVRQQTRISTTNTIVCFMFLKRVISVKDITLFVVLRHKNLIHTATSITFQVNSDVFIADFFKFSDNFSTLAVL